MAAKATFLVCPEHKTAVTYGAMSKHMPESSRIAFDLFCQLPCRKSQYFFEPPSEGSRVAATSALLKRFGIMAFGMDEPPTATLIRKLFHTVLLRMSREGDAMALMQQIDGHSAGIARRIYSVPTAEDDSKLAALLYTELFGAPVDFPSDSDISEMGITIESILQDGSNTAGKWETVCEDDGGDQFEKQFTLLVPLCDDALTPEATPEFQMLAIEDQHVDLVPLADLDFATPAAGDVLTDAAKAYLESQSPKDKSGRVRCPSRSRLMEIINDGQADGTLDPDVQPSSIESYLISIGKRLMTEQEKAYILSKMPQLSDGDIVVPSRSTFKAVVEEGVAAGTLHAAVTSEGARSFVRKHVAEQTKKQDD